MNDHDIIKQAYADTLRRLFATLFESSVIADNKTQRKAAEDAFQTGVAFAREIRDRALALL